MSGCNIPHRIWRKVLDTIYVETPLNHVDVFYEIENFKKISKGMKSVRILINFPLLSFFEIFFECLMD